VTAPTDAMAPGILPGRYLNFDVTFGLTFDQPNKMVILTPKALKIGAKTILDENSEASQAAFNSSFNKAFMNSFAPAFNQSFNQGLRKNPDVAKFLDHAKSIEIKDSELVIETQ